MTYKGARTAMTFTAVAVGSVATKVSITTGMDGKEFMFIANVGTKPMFIGASNVTASTGYPINPRGAYDFGLCTPLFNFYVIAVSGSTTTLSKFET